MSADPDENDNEPDGPLGSAAPAGVPLRGQISHVTGRKAQGGQRGQPALDRLSLDLGDGTSLDFGPPDAEEAGTLATLGGIQFGSFNRDGRSCCPICLDGDPTHREHVPQRELGGRIMTMTCQRCNNNLGARVEADLQNWFDHALVDVAFDHDG